jgi:hypothetical protein
MAAVYLRTVLQHSANQCSVYFVDSDDKQRFFPLEGIKGL